MKTYDKYVKKINLTDKIKQKNLKKKRVTICEMFGIRLCTRFKKNKHKILDKCQEFHETTLNIDNIVNKLFEINLMKSILFTSKQ